MGLLRKDAQLKVTRALPNGIATVASDGFDLGHGARGDHLAQVELAIAAPALTTTELPDTKTLKFDVYHDTASNFGSETLLLRDVLVQTGAGGAGAAAASANVRLPIDVNRYVRVKATKDGTGDATAKSATLELVF